MSDPSVQLDQGQSGIVMAVTIICGSTKYISLLCHFYPIVPGWAIDVNILEEFDQEGVQDIFIVDPDTNLTFKATLFDFRDHGVPVPHSLNFHLCLPLQYWSVSPTIENPPPSCNQHQAFSFNYEPGQPNK
jgi:hypothetical protein